MKQWVKKLFKKVMDRVVNRFLYPSDDVRRAEWTGLFLCGSLGGGLLLLWLISGASGPLPIVLGVLAVGFFGNLTFILVRKLGEWHRARSDSSKAGTRDS